MRLIQFRVQNFKSIKDSGWVEVGQLSCLLGTNEAGKTNTLQGLWKLKPANNEPIIPLSDYPRKKYSGYDNTEGTEVFITADFEADAKIIAAVSAIYNDSEADNEDEDEDEDDETEEDDDNASDNEEEDDNAEEEEVEEEIVFSIVRVARRYDSLYIIELLGADGAVVSQVEDQRIQDAIVEALPQFVYFSDYGNLDSEIYLPHVIENAQRPDLGERERAKARSLNVLFSYVQLKPKQILDLGTESPTQQLNHSNQLVAARPTAEQIEKDRAKKKKREILLTSASSQLTQAFREWWKQGDYRFRFQADGNHFRIWVSDDRRPEEVELESRSRGLQWFFSFFLVFLVEAKNTHHNSILLLDEPGLSLHPLAQADLIKFFAALSVDNQLVYTTHSPFLVEPNNLANIKAVYVDADGQSTISGNLRQGSNVAEQSIYPVHAAIGLTVSEGLLLGCQPVMVEGPSDQIYLQLIKNILSGNGKYQHHKDLVFIPTGGVSGMKPIISILAGRDNVLPYAVLDSDKAGRDKETQLKGGIYKDEKDKLIGMSQILGAGDYEIEDLIPANELARVFSKDYRGKQTDDFDDTVDSSKPIIPQMEDFAAANGYVLENGWKVDLAKSMQKASARLSSNVTSDQLKLWKKLFDKLTKN